MPEPQELHAPFESSMSEGEKATFHKHVPSYIRPHTQSYVNAIGDGNCGFRSVAHAVLNTEDKWPTIRTILSMYLENDKNRDYLKEYACHGIEENYKDVQESLKWESGPCNKEYAMLMPYTGISNNCHICAR